MTTKWQPEDAFVTKFVEPKVKLNLLETLVSRTIWRLFVLHLIGHTAAIYEAVFINQQASVRQKRILWQLKCVATTVVN